MRSSLLSLLSASSWLLVALCLVGCGPSVGATTPAPRASHEPSSLLVQIAELTTGLVQPPEHDLSELEALHASASDDAREALGRQLIRAHLAEIEALTDRRASLVSALATAEEESRAERAAELEQDDDEPEPEAEEPVEERLQDEADDDEADDDEADDDEAGDDDGGWDDDSEEDDWGDDEEDDCTEWEREWEDCGEWASARRDLTSRAKKDQAPRRMDRRARLRRRRARLQRRRALRRRQARRGQAQQEAPAPAERRVARREESEGVSEARASLVSLDHELRDQRQALASLDSRLGPQLAAEHGFAQMWSAWRTQASNAATLARGFTEAHGSAGDLLALAWMVRAELAAREGDSESALAAFRFGMNRLGEPVYAFALWRSAQLRDDEGDEQGALEARRALAHAGCEGDAHAIVRALAHDAAAALGEGLRRDADGALRPQSCASPSANDEGWRPAE